MKKNAAFRNFAFFESYFSNYIEGTEFEIEDARQIIETGQPMPARNEVIIPTVFRDDYLNSLRRLTRKGDPAVLIRAISRVRQFSANITGADFDATRNYLEACNAFKESEEYILRF